LLGELRGDRVQVTDDSEVGELEDRCFGVLVDRDDVLRGLHTGTVLDRTGDTERDVQVRADRLTGLTDLELVRVPPGVDDGAGSTGGTTEGVGQVLDDGEVVGTHTTAAGDHDGGLGEFGALTLLLGHTLDALGALGGLGEGDRAGFLGRGTGGGLRNHGVRAHRDDRNTGLHAGVGDGCATEDAVFGDDVGVDVDDVGEYPRAQLHGGTACDLLVLGCGRDQDRGGALVTGELGEQLGLGGHDVVVQLRGGHVHLFGTVLGQRGLAGVGSVTDPYCGGLTDATCHGQQFGGDLLDLSVDVVDEDEDLSHDL